MQTQYAKALHDITQYVSTHYAGRIYAVYGLSDSCGLLLAMLRQGKIHSSKTIIESDGCPPGYFAFSLLPPKSYSEGALTCDEKTVLPARPPLLSLP